MKASVVGHMEPVVFGKKGIEHKDTGCKHWPSCLNCPFGKCVEDIGGRAFRSLLKRLRNKEMLRKYCAGQTISDIAKEYGVCQRTIQRVLRDGAD